MSQIPASIPGLTLTLPERIGPPPARRCTEVFPGGGPWMPPQGPPAVGRVALAELPQPRRREEVRITFDYKGGVISGRLECADLVRAAGCLCRSLHTAASSVSEAKFVNEGWGGAVEAHDPRCPIALAAAIEALP